MVEKADAILAKYGVKDYLGYNYRREHRTETRYIRKGCGGPKRKKRLVRRIRYQITEVTRDEAAITSALCYMGWRLYATNHMESDLPLGEAVLLYRAAPRIERHFQVKAKPTLLV